MPSARRFPPPWTLDEANDASFIVKDATRQALAYFYFEDEPGRRSAYFPNCTMHPVTGIPSNTPSESLQGALSRAKPVRKSAIAVSPNVSATTFKAI